MEGSNLYKRIRVNDNANKENTYFVIPYEYHKYLGEFFKQFQEELIPINNETIVPKLGPSTILIIEPNLEPSTIPIIVPKLGPSTVSIIEPKIDPIIETKTFGEVGKVKITLNSKYNKNYCGYCKKEVSNNPTNWNNHLNTEAHILNVIKDVGEKEFIENPKKYVTKFTTSKKVNGIGYYEKIFYNFLYKNPTESYNEIIDGKINLHAASIIFHVNIREILKRLKEVIPSKGLKLDSKNVDDSDNDSDVEINSKHIDVTMLENQYNESDNDEIKYDEGTEFDWDKLIELTESKLPSVIRDTHINNSFCKRCEIEVLPKDVLYHIISSKHLRIEDYKQDPDVYRYVLFNYFNSNPKEALDKINNGELKLNHIYNLFKYKAEEIKHLLILMIESPPSKISEMIVYLARDYN